MVAVYGPHGSRRKQLHRFGLSNTDTKKYFNKSIMEFMTN